MGLTISQRLDPFEAYQHNLGYVLMSSYIICQQYNKIFIIFFIGYINELE